MKYLCAGIATQLTTDKTMSTEERMAVWEGFITRYEQLVKERDQE